MTITTVCLDLFAPLMEQQTMRFKRLWMLLVLMTLSIMSVQAQDDPSTFIQLTTDTDTLQTGERYTVRLDVVDIESFWGGDIFISYDPSLVYVVGSQAGSPFDIGDMMSEGGSTLFNRVNDDQGELRVAVSMFNPADPVTGSGTIATFDIVPLLAGTAEFRFTSVELLSVEFTTDDDGQRVGSNPTPIEFLPILLTINTEGDPATPPSEATATPTPTVTVNPALSVDSETQTIEPTLINVTAVPMTATPLELLEAPDEQPPSGNSTLLLIAVGLVAISVIGLGALFFVARRQQT